MDEPSIEQVIAEDPQAVLDVIHERLAANRERLIDVGGNIAGEVFARIQAQSAQVDGIKRKLRRNVRRRLSDTQTQIMPVVESLAAAVSSAVGENNVRLNQVRGRIAAAGTVALPTPLDHGPVFSNVTVLGTAGGDDAFVGIPAEPPESMPEERASPPVPTPNTQGLAGGNLAYFLEMPETAKANPEAWLAGKCYQPPRSTHYATAGRYMDVSWTYKECADVAILEGWKLTETVPLNEISATGAPGPGQCFPECSAAGDTLPGGVDGEIPEDTLPPSDSCERVCTTTEGWQRPEDESGGPWYLLIEPPTRVFAWRDEGYGETAMATLWANSGYQLLSGPYATLADLAEYADVSYPPRETCEEVCDDKEPPPPPAKEECCPEVNLAECCPPVDLDTPIAFLFWPGAKDWRSNAAKFVGINVTELAGKSIKQLADERVAAVPRPRPAEQPGLIIAGP